MTDFPALLSRFTKAVAANDGAAFSGLFTEDGVYDDGFFGEYKGRKAIAEMLQNGFDGLVTAVLTLVGVGILLLTLDFRLGAVCLLCFPILLLLVRWFSVSSTRAYRRVRELSALVIVQFVETMSGIRAVLAYRRQPRNAEIFEDVADRYAGANVRSFRLVSVFMPGVKLIGNVTIGVVLIYGGYLVIEGELQLARQTTAQHGCKDNASGRAARTELIAGLSNNRRASLARACRSRPHPPQHQPPSARSWNSHLPPNPGCIPEPA